MVLSPANLIVFLSDNHARDVMGCAGHPWVKTPAMDALAAEGVLFEQGYTASPVCCPARAALATGRYPSETHYWDNALAYDGRVPSWMRRVREQGHEVVSIGKLHFRGGDDYGFSEEILPMHLHAGKGAVRQLLRGYDAEQARESSAFYDLYAKRSGEGHTAYQDYDADITRAAQDWLGAHSAPGGKPWVLFVSWISPHPPFTVPKRLLDLYPVEQMPLPPGWQGEGWAAHPAYRHLRRLERLPDEMDPDMLRQVAAGYFGLISHLDEQLGKVMETVRTLGLDRTTRLLYTSDHGELFGAHGLFGKKVLYDASAGVPMIVAGPGLPKGARRAAPVSHVDLFPTVLEAVGATPAAEDASLHGRSLWGPAAGAENADRPVFAEYHAHGSPAGAFMLRQGRWKLIHYVGLPPQLFDIVADPQELHDLAGQPQHTALTASLQEALRRFCDPEAADAAAKADQRARVEELGGRDAVLAEQLILFSPPPGQELEKTPN
ncbi:sulfatase-like hydrolase/transferase [Roseomonas sp. HJA6]|uniref:Sulfatase-like hydrolase/transferase n=1 Tax=Roseomonas alba TaxID=2846776 RepID=A0ABS7A4U0_9PROT|nr:sulfatase-like hydrolase/transferase [Neoroseomonas alba]MBW6397314.1 sulfatase-like hydrolase/transferase [Neoroseomonas alba]